MKKYNESMNYMKETLPTRVENIISDFFDEEKLSFIKDEKVKQDILDGNFKVSVSFNKGSVGLENHTLDSLSMSISVGNTSTNVNIVRGADKAFGNIEINIEELKDILTNKFLGEKITSSFKNIDTRVLEKKEEARQHEDTAGMFDKLNMKTNMGDLKIFINNAPKRLYYLAANNAATNITKSKAENGSDYLHFDSNISGQKFNFSLEIKVDEASGEYNVNIGARPTNAIGSGLVLKRYITTSVKEAKKLIEKYSNMKSLQNIIEVGGEGMNGAIYDSDRNSGIIAYRTKVVTEEKSKTPTIS